MMRMGQRNDAAVLMTVAVVVAKENLFDFNPLAFVVSTETYIYRLLAVCVYVCIASNA